MPRPKTKEELVEQSHGNFDKLLRFVDSLPAVQQNLDFPEGSLNRNIRDVLGHLHAWHLMFIDWYKVGELGEKPEMPAKGYTWKDTPKLNQHIWKEYQSFSLSEVRKMLNDSFAAVQSIIDQHSDKELFEKKKYIWTGSTSLASYLISSTSSHYHWALTFIKKSLK